MKREDRLLYQIFTSFFKVGLLTIGGGYAMLPIAQKEVIDRRGWVSQEELMRFYGIAQLSMGIIAINTCALIGYRVYGKRGAVLAGISSALPSILIITMIAMFFQNIMDIAIITRLFESVRIVVFAMVLSTAFRFIKNGVKDGIGLIVYGMAFVLITFLNVHPILVIVLAAVLGIVLYPYRRTS